MLMHTHCTKLRCFYRCTKVLFSVRETSHVGRKCLNFSSFIQRCLVWSPSRMKSLRTFTFHISGLWKERFISLYRQTPQALVGVTRLSDDGRFSRRIFNVKPKIPNRCFMPRQDPSRPQTSGFGAWTWPGLKRSAGTEQTLNPKHKEFERSECKRSTNSRGLRCQRLFFFLPTRLLLCGWYCLIYICFFSSDFVNLESNFVLFIIWCDARGEFPLG